MVEQVATKVALWQHPVMLTAKVLLQLTQAGKHLATVLAGALSADLSPAQGDGVPVAGGTPVPGSCLSGGELARTQAAVVLQLGARVHQELVGLQGGLIECGEGAESAGVGVMVWQSKVEAAMVVEHVTAQGEVVAECGRTLGAREEVEAPEDHWHRPVDHHHQLHVAGAGQVLLQSPMVVHCHLAELAVEHTIPVMQGHMAHQVTVPVTVEVAGVALEWRLVDYGSYVVQH